jgi:hypothetical protein
MRFIVRDLLWLMVDIGVVALVVFSSRDYRRADSRNGYGGGQAIR